MEKKLTVNVPNSIHQKLAENSMKPPAGSQVQLNEQAPAVNGGGVAAGPAAPLNQPKKEKIRDYALYLRETIYPSLHVSLEKLVEHLIATNEVQEHQERLRQQKVLDRVEQKRLDKERLKAELGSEYESSGESIDLDEAGPGLGGQHRGGGEDDSLGKMNDEPFDDSKNLLLQEDLQPIKVGGKLGDIQEEAAEQAASPKGIDISHHEEKPIFDPIEFLIDRLRELQAKGVK